MPADVFWTGLFTFGGGLVGAVGGYATAHRQSDVQERQLKLEERRQSSEESRSDEERHDHEREQRRAVYLRYLSSLDGITNCTSRDSLDQSTLTDLWTSFSQADNELELVGTEEIKSASYPLQHLAADLVNGFSGILSDANGSWPEDAIRLKADRKDELRQLRREMTAQMRQDLDPPSGGPSAGTS